MYLLKLFLFFKNATKSILRKIVKMNLLSTCNKLKNHAAETKSKRPSIFLNTNIHFPGFGNNLIVLGKNNVRKGKTNRNKKKYD